MEEELVRYEEQVREQEELGLRDHQVQDPLEDMRVCKEPEGQLQEEERNHLPEALHMEHQELLQGEVQEEEVQRLQQLKGCMKCLPPGRMDSLSRWHGSKVSLTASTQEGEQKRFLSQHRCCGA